MEKLCLEWTKWHEGRLEMWKRGNVKELDVTDQSLRKPFIATFNEPEKVDEFTFDKDGAVHLGRSDAGVYFNNKSALPFDLEAGIEMWQRKSDADTRLADIFKYLEARHPPGTSLQDAFHGAEFVMFRGMVTRICMTIHQNKKWSFTAVPHQGMIFIVEEKVDDGYQCSDQLTYSGYKFEQYLTRKANEKAPNTSQPVCNQEQFVVCMKAKIDSKSGRKPVEIFYVGEVDAVDEDGRLIEMKTCQHWVEHDFRQLKWVSSYIQSHLVGVHALVYGVKRDKSKRIMVDKLGYVKIEDLARRTRKTDLSYRILYEVLAMTRRNIRTYRQPVQVTCSNGRVKVKHVDVTISTVDPNNVLSEYGSQ